MLIYLATPYSHPDKHVEHARFLAACRVAGRLMNAGHHVFSPIACTHPIAMACGLPTGWEYWREFDEKMISVCDELHVVMIPGWSDSRGVTAEIEIAERLGVKVRWVAYCERPTMIAEDAEAHRAGEVTR